MIIERLKDGETVDLKSVLGMVWTCKKCDLIRSNRITHTHGKPLPEWALKTINEKDKEEKDGGKTA